LYLELPVSNFEESGAARLRIDVAELRPFEDAVKRVRTR
jgi:hypothetical protein